MGPIVSMDQIAERARLAVEQGVPLAAAQRYPAETQGAQLFEREYLAALQKSPPTNAAASTALPNAAVPVALLDVHVEERPLGLRSHEALVHVRRHAAVLVDGSGCELDFENLGLCVVADAAEACR